MLMFTKQELEDDRNFNFIINTMLKKDERKIGKFIDIETKSELVSKMTTAHFENIKYLPKSNLLILKTSDLGFGYSSYISPSKLQELINMGKVDKNIPIKFEYSYGNIFTSIDIENIDPDLLITDDIYFFMHEPTKKLWIGVIGKPTSPNFLYYKKELDGIVTTLDNVSHIARINRINVFENIKCDFI